MLNISNRREVEPGIKVKVYNCKNHSAVIYPNINAAAQVLGLNTKTISWHIRMNERYVITKT